MSTNQVGGCYGLNYANPLPNSSVKVLISNVIVYGDRAFQVIKVK